MIECQNAPLDLLMFYDARVGHQMNNMFDHLSYRPKKGYYPFLSWRRLRDLGTQVRTSVETKDLAVEKNIKLKQLFACAAKGSDGRLAIFLARNTNDGNVVEPRRVHLALPTDIQVDWDRARCYLTDDEMTHSETPLTVHPDGSVSIVMMPSSFALIECETKPRHPKGTIVCAGTYDGHLQGVATDGTFIYWSFAKAIVKTDRAGRIVALTHQAYHQGDCCVKDGVLYVAVNQGGWHGESKDRSEVWLYDAKDLSLKKKVRVPELIYGAGGITWKDDRFYVVGGLHPTHVKNYVYEYTSDFTFVKRHDLETGYTELGIQTASVLRDKFVFGCYPAKKNPIRTLICPTDLSSFATSPVITDVGVLELDGRLYSARTEKAGARGEWNGVLLPVQGNRL